MVLGSLFSIQYSEVISQGFYWVIMGVDRIINRSQRAFKNTNMQILFHKTDLLIINAWMHICEMEKNDMSDMQTITEEKKNTGYKCDEGSICIFQKIIFVTFYRHQSRVEISLLMLSSFSYSQLYNYGK